MGLLKFFPVEEMLKWVIKINAPIADAKLVRWRPPTSGRTIRCAASVIALRVNFGQAPATAGAIHSKIAACGMQFKIDRKKTADYADHADKCRGSTFGISIRITPRAI